MAEIPEWVWWLLGICLGVIFALIGVIYWALRREDERNAKNIHDLRAQMSPLTLWVAVIREKLGLGSDRD